MAQALSISVKPITWHCRCKTLLPRANLNANDKVGSFWNRRTCRIPGHLYAGRRSPEVYTENPTSTGPNLWNWSKSRKQLIAYGLLFAGIPLGSLLPDTSWSSSFYFFYIGVWVLYVGSHKSLDANQKQKLSLQEGVLLPLLLSISLFGFYCLLRFFPDIDLKAILSVYFSLVSVVAVARNVAEPIAILLPVTNANLIQIELPAWMSDDEESAVKVTSRFADLVAFSIGILMIITKNNSGSPFIFNNIIASCIATEVLSFLSLGSFVTASTLLFGLLIYDVFWVFGSSGIIGENVMVTVATSSAFDGPIKLIFPHHEGTSSLPYSLLGLGDIVLPGLLTALMLRFDRYCLTRRKDRDNENSRQGPLCHLDKLYFITSLTAYIVGLALTIAANSVSGEAQPALLYLVPCQIVSIMIISCMASELNLLLNYKEELFDK